MKEKLSTNLASLLEVAPFVPARVDNKASAWVGHIPFAAWLIRQLKPGIFVELGTHSGNSYLTFCQAVDEGKLSTECYAIDTWQGDVHSGLYGDEVFVELSKYHDTNYSSFSRLLKMTFDDAAAYFSPESIDLLHIDGLHTYDAVRHDFETWLPKLAPGAVVLFHDSNVREQGFGVWKFLEELRSQYPRSLEFLHSYGLGVLQLNSATPSGEFDFANVYENEQIITQYFSSLGARIVEKVKLEARIEALESLISERDKKIEAIEWLISERDKRLQELEQQLAQVGASYEAIASSRIWRASRPLRMIVTWIRGR